MLADCLTSFTRPPIDNFDSTRYTGDIGGCGHNHQFSTAWQGADTPTSCPSAGTNCEEGTGRHSGIDILQDDLGTHLSTNTRCSQTSQCPTGQTCVSNVCLTPVYAVASGFVSSGNAKSGQCAGPGICDKHTTTWDCTHDGQSCRSVKKDAISGYTISGRHVVIDHSVIGATGDCVDGRCLGGLEPLKPCAATTECRIHHYYSIYNHLSQVVVDLTGPGHCTTSGKCKGGAIPDHPCSADTDCSGTPVACGELLGYVGKTGAATGEHLHFQIDKEYDSRDGSRILSHPTACGKDIDVCPDRACEAKTRRPFGKPDVSNARPLGALQDFDGDGFGPDSDCDDTDATKHPGGQPCSSESQPTLRVDGSTSSSKQQGETFSYAGSGYTANGTVTRHFRLPNGIEAPPSTLTADSNGHISWDYLTNCTNPVGTTTVWVVDGTRTSNTVSQIVTASSSCGQPTCSQTFQAGESVVTLFALTVRESADSKATVSRIVSTGTSGTVLEGPVSASGYCWSRIAYNDGFGTTGWSAEGNATSKYLVANGCTPIVKTTLPFDQTQVGACSDAIVSIKNPTSCPDLAGTAEIDSFQVPPCAQDAALSFTVANPAESAYSLPSGSNHGVTIHFCPPCAGSYSGRVDFHPDRDFARTDLSGYGGTTARFVDNGDGTISDNGTGLQWEKKTTPVRSGSNYADPHDVDNLYPWCLDANRDFICDTTGSPPDGGAFTSFLPALNAGSGFAGRTDWRLPTIAALRTIVDPNRGYCGGLTGGACIDPIFGPTTDDSYLSTTTDPTDPGKMFQVNFEDGQPYRDDKTDTFWIRAVRGGTPTTRYIDNQDGTITDTQTGLQWEKKTTVVGSGSNYADPHDVDNSYSWSATPNGTAQDGTAFTQFLHTLNTQPCFAKHCDWRLPHVNRDGDHAELETILLAPYPCRWALCIDPIFGSSSTGLYWSATTNAIIPASAWSMSFRDGYMDYGFGKNSGWFVRAVRNGP